MKQYLKEIDARAGILSPLEKVFPGQEEYPEISEILAFRGERVHFQVAVRTLDLLDAVLHLSGPLSRYAEIREVVFTPCLTPAPPDDPEVISSAPGLYPGPLVKREGNVIVLEPNCTGAFWVTLDIPEDCEPGETLLELKLELKPYWGDLPEISIPLPVRIVKHILPPQKLACEMWFHGDCLMTHYKVRCWSESYWKILEDWFRDMSRHGLDTLLTPLWTLPLDTHPGCERPTVQLLSVSKRKDGSYAFGFRRLQRWIDTARRAGIRRFSFSHLYTQWGLKATPKIVGRENGVEKRLFGWDVPSDSPEYRTFLTCLFRKLIPFLRKNGLTEKDVYFHLSDEPQKAHLEKYSECSRFVHGFLSGYRTLDAMSDPVFFDQGLVECPAVSENALDAFLDRNMPERWLYYCGEWRNRVPNRKLGMSSVRNRILGVLLYLYRMDGFLEWGYNFWYSVHSLHQDLNPFDIRSISRIFGNNGGAYAVLPGEDGKPVPTVHYEVFADALQDLRALQLLESRIGRASVEQMIREGRETPITLHDWPSDPAWLLNLRKRIADRLDAEDRRIVRSGL